MGKIHNFSKVLLQKLYLEKQKSIREIATELKCGEATVFTYLLQHNIPTRSRDAHKTGRVFSNDTKQKIRKKATGRKMSDSTKRKISEALKGKKKPWFTGRMKDRDGYILLFLPEHPNANKSGYVLEHRKIMADLIERPLRKDDIVHHKNGKKDDNRISNLELTTRIKHKDLHTAEVKCPFCTKEFIVRNGQK